MIINIRAVREREAQIKAEVKPPPKIRVISLGNFSEPPAKKVLKSHEPVVAPSVPMEFAATEKDLILKGLWEQITDVKKDRAKVSTATHDLVESTREKLAKESPAAAKAFMEGELRMPEIEAQWETIQGYTNQAISLWDKIRHVEQYGKLPDEEPLLAESSADASALKYEIRRLTDFICKKKANLERKVPKNPERVALWKEDIARAEAERDMKTQQLKRLQYEARSQRTGEE